VGYVNFVEMFGAKGVESVEKIVGLTAEEWNGMGVNPSQRMKILSGAQAILNG